MAKFTAVRPFFWDGKDVKVGDGVELSDIEAKWMLARKAVVAGAPKKPEPVKKVKAKK